MYLNNTMLFTWIVLIMAVMFMSKVKQNIRRRQSEYIKRVNEELDVTKSKMNESIMEKMKPSPSPSPHIHEEIDIFMYHEFDNPLIYVGI